METPTFECSRQSLGIRGNRFRVKNLLFEESLAKKRLLSSALKQPRGDAGPFHFIKIAPRSLPE